MKKSNSKTAIQCVAFVCALILFSQVSMAGSLEPNAPPAPTMKTLSEIEPRIPIPASDTPVSVYHITQSGSYYLQGDRQCQGTYGISVDVNNVTIDLCGFSLIGNSALYGIYMNGRSNVEVRNGTVRNFYIGVDEESSYGIGHRVIGVRATSNTSSGIHLVGKGHEVRGCTATYNGTSASGGSSIYGIYTGNSSTVIGNTDSNNGTSATTSVYGLFAGAGSTVSGNTVCNNCTSANYGWLYGLMGGTGCTITGNTVYNNGNSANITNIFNALEAGAGSTVIGNTVYNNGISATGGGTFCGIFLDGNNLVDQNTAYNNSGTNMNNPGTCTFGKNLPQLP